MTQAEELRHKYYDIDKKHQMKPRQVTSTSPSKQMPAPSPLSTAQARLAAKLARRREQDDMYEREKKTVTTVVPTSPTRAESPQKHESSHMLSRLILDRTDESPLLSPRPLHAASPRSSASRKQDEAVINGVSDVSVSRIDKLRERAHHVQECDVRDAPSLKQDRVDRVQIVNESVPAAASRSTSVLTSGVAVRFLPTTDACKRRSPRKLSRRQPPPNAALSFAMANELRIQMPHR